MASAASIRGPVVRRTTDVCAPDVPHTASILDLRFVCEDCRVKWFVPAGRSIDDAAAGCAACGGRLIPLEHEGNLRPAQSDDADAP
jgi:hypothetical protein